MAEPLIATIEYSHKCICSDVTERHPDTTITYLAELGDDNKDIMYMFNLKGGDLKAFINSIRSHSTIVDVRVLRKSDSSVDIITTSNIEASTHLALREAKCAFVCNPIYEPGIEKTRIFAPSFSALKQFIDSLRSSYNVKVTSKHFLKPKEKITTDSLVKRGYLDLMEATERLTQRQVETLKLASKLGYYEMPKKNNMKDIADRMNISEAAASELLRKAEKKLIPTIAKIIETQK